MDVFGRFVDSIDQRVVRAGPLNAALGACGLAVAGILLIVFPGLLALIAGLALVVVALLVLASVVLRAQWRVRWQDAPISEPSNPPPPSETAGAAHP